MVWIVMSLTSTASVAMKSRRVRLASFLIKDLVDHAATISTVKTSVSYVSMGTVSSIYSF